MSNTWEKTGRDAADEDIAGGAEPCTTLAEARRRIGQWLRSQTPAVAAAEAETCAAAYLRAWQAHATGNVPPLDLDAIEARYLAASERTGAMPPVWRSASDVPALVARVHALEAKLGASAQALDDLVAQVWRAAGEEHEPLADMGALLARVEGLRAGRNVAFSAGVEAARSACADHCARRAEALDAAAGDDPDPDDPKVTEDYGRFCEAHELATALRLVSRPDMEDALRDADARVAAARREGAEAMRESCASRAKEHAEALKAEATDALRRDHSAASRSYSMAASSVGAVVGDLRALPLPGGEP